MGSEDYYLILGVARNADQDAIRKAYHRLAMLHHPDRNPDDPGAAERFRKIHEAYQVLGNPQKRQMYDRPFAGFESYAGSYTLQAYLDARVDRISARLNEEVELTYVFGPEGRFFKKPDLRGWYLAGGPVVDHRLVSRSGQLVRETTLRYTVCPMISGDLVIPAASIRYNHQLCVSNEIKLHIEPNECYFRQGERAGGNPLRVYLHKEQLTSQTIYAKVMLHQHVVLIPRSDLAAWYHKVGRILKIGMAACGAAWAALHGDSSIIGALAGSAFGGLNCHIMYRTMGIKSRFYYAHQHPLVQEYYEEGYLPGREPNEGLFGSKKGIKRWEFVKSLFL